MGKKGGAKSVGSRSHTPISLREEATGKIQINAASNAKSKLRLEHLKKLAGWATTSDPPIPSLGAFYGHQLASFGEATGVPPDPSLITCQRCETVLQPGFNSTVRIEKNKSKAMHRRKKSGSISQNSVVYKCHFCLHQNRKRGTPKGYLKGICPSKDKPSLESTPPSKPISRKSYKLEKGIVNKDEANGIDVFNSQTNKDALVDGLATPSSTNTTNLLEGRKRRRNSSSSKKAFETTNTSGKEVVKTVSTSSKRRKKSWTSLKEIAQGNNHQDSQITNLSIPFFL